MAGVPGADFLAGEAWLALGSVGVAGGRSSGFVAGADAGAGEAAGVVDPAFGATFFLVGVFVVPAVFLREPSFRRRAEPGASSSFAAVSRFCSSASVVPLSRVCCLYICSDIGNKGQTPCMLLTIVGSYSLSPRHIQASIDSCGFLTLFLRHWRIIC